MRSTVQLRRNLRGVGLRPAGFRIGLAAASAALVLLGAEHTDAQPLEVARPAFEVASVRENPQGLLRFRREPGGLRVEGLPLSGLILSAYPGRTRSDRMEAARIG